MIRLSALLLVLLLVTIAGDEPRAFRYAGTFPPRAYVWTKDMSVERVAEIGGRCVHLDGVRLLVAELGYDPTSQQARVIYRIPEEARARLDAWCPSVSHGVRVRAGSARFRESAKALAEALPTLETSLEIDFDGGPAELPWLKILLETARDRLPKTPLTFAAKPAWLEAPSFLSLARAFPGYSLKIRDYDSTAVESTVTRAARLGVPFDLVLPIVSRVAETVVDGKVRRALKGPNPEVVQRDLARWENGRPAAFRGVTWYRLPTSTDRRSWSYSLWQRVLRRELVVRAGAPRAAFTADASDPNVYNLVLENPGEEPRSLASLVTLHWSHPDDPRLYDLLNKDAATVEKSTKNSVTLRIGSDDRPVLLAPGERKTIAWARGKNLSMEGLF